MEATISLDRFNDISQWDHVDYNVPIFIEHELWEVPHPWQKGAKVHLAVFPGDEKPKVGTMLYSIGNKELQDTAKKINHSLKTTGNAVGVFIGHRNQKAAEQDNPKVIGHGVGATVGTFGPKGIKAVLADKICYERGQYEEAKTYPHRSPEFKPLTGQLTGLALLRNDPKLPMGVMMGYKDADVMCYGPDFIEGGNDNAQSGDKAGEGTKVPTNIEPKGTQQDPTKPPTVAEPDPAKHEEWRQHMEHYKRNDPMMLQMCKNYEAECASAMAPAEGSPKIEGDEEKIVKDEEQLMDDEESVDMADKTPTVTYAAFQALSAKVDTLSTVNAELSTKYAESESLRYEGTLKRKKVIKDPKKLHERFMAAPNAAGRKAVFDDVMLNYADRDVPDRDPSWSEPIEVYEGAVEGGDETPDILSDPMDMTEAVKYAEDNKLDMDKDYDKICAAIAKKNGKPVLAK